MKISIITVSYNSENTIEYTLRSVSNQSYNNIEYIIVDGGSTDSTNEIIQRYGSTVKIHISEKDSGIYNAMNKGLSLATGDVIGFLNSDDMFENETIIEQIAKSFVEKNVDTVHADLVYVNAEFPDKIMRYWKSRTFKKGMFGNGIFPPHPTFYAKKSLYKKFGVFNENIKIAADFDLMMRFLEVGNSSNFYLPIIAVRMRAGGASNAGVKQIIHGLKESVECFGRYSVSGRLLFVPKTLLRRFLQIFGKAQ